MEFEKRQVDGGKRGFRAMLRGLRVIIVVVQLFNPLCFRGKFMPTSIRIESDPFYRGAPAVKIEDNQYGHLLRWLLPHQIVIDVLFQVELRRQQGGLVVHAQQARLPFQVHDDLQRQTPPDFGVLSMPFLITSISFF
jgi:hypothetical protein